LIQDALLEELAFFHKTVLLHSSVLLGPLHSRLIALGRYIHLCGCSRTTLAAAEALTYIGLDLCLSISYIGSCILTRLGTAARLAPILLNINIAELLEHTHSIVFLEVLEHIHSIIFLEELEQTHSIVYLEEHRALDFRNYFRLKVSQ
jgi:hypothetical protein